MVEIENDLVDKIREYLKKDNKEIEEALSLLQEAIAEIQQLEYDLAREYYL